MKKYLFSLIVPTLNRKAELVLLLQSLETQEVTDFEVIIVDQNEDEILTEIINRFSSTLKIKHIRQAAKGASSARNGGLKCAEGEIITFPDDDCEYPSDLLANIAALFDKNPQWSGITCTTKSREDGEAIARHSKNEGVITKYNILSRTAEATIFVRSSIVTDFYFDEDLGVGARTPWWSDEGPDFVLRLINKGYSFFYLPHIFIYHPNPIRVFDEKTIIRSYKYGCGRGRYLKKHRYPLWYVVYVWGLYIAGILMGCLRLNTGQIKYYYQGLRGRIFGFVS